MSGPPDRTLVRNAKREGARCLSIPRFRSFRNTSFFMVPGFPAPNRPVRARFSIIPLRKTAYRAPIGHAVRNRPIWPFLPNALRKRYQRRASTASGIASGNVLSGYPYGRSLTERDCEAHFSEGFCRIVMLVLIVRKGNCHRLYPSFLNPGMQSLFLTKICSISRFQFFSEIFQI